MEFLPGTDMRTFQKEHADIPNLRDELEISLGELGSGVHQLQASGNHQIFPRKSQLGDPDIWTDTRNINNISDNVITFTSENMYDNYPIHNIRTEILENLLDLNSTIKFHSIQLGSTLDQLYRFANNRNAIARYNMPFGSIVNHLDLKPENVMICPDEEMEGFKTRGFKKTFGGKKYRMVLIDFDLSGPGDSYFNEFGEIFLSVQTESEEQQKRTVKNILHGFGMNDYDKEECINIFHTVGIIMRIMTLARHLRYAEEIDSKERVAKYIRDLNILFQYPQLAQRAYTLRTWLIDKIQRY